MDLTQYTPEFFQQQQHEEQLRFEAARKPTPVYNMDYLHQIYTDEELARAGPRLQEFLDCTRFILKRRLQPGWAKVGKHISLGQCPPPLFHHWFGLICKGISKQRITKYTMDGLRYPNRIIYYRWPKHRLPLLNTNEEWYTRDHGNGHGNFSSNVKSYYTEITLSIEEDTGRVHCGYRQCTAACIGDITFATA
jgi:hypothetical protein